MITDLGTILINQILNKFPSPPSGQFQVSLYTISITDSALLLVKLDPLICALLKSTRAMAPPIETQSYITDLFFEFLW